MWYDLGKNKPECVAKNVFQTAVNLGPVLEQFPNLVYSICVVLLFSRVELRKKVLFKIAAESAVFFGVWSLVRWTLQQIPFVAGPLQSNYGTLHIYNTVFTILAGLCLRDLRVETRIVSGVVFSTMYILCMGFAPNLVLRLTDMTFREVFLAPQTDLLITAISLGSALLLKRWSIEIIPFLSQNYMVLVVFISVALAETSPIFNILLRKAGETGPFYTVYHLLAMLLTLVVYLIFYQGSKEYNDLITAAVISQKQQAESRMLELTEKNLEEMRKFRHDSKNHYAVMTELLRDRDYDKLQAYFDQLVARLNTFSTIQTGNRAVNAILNTKAVEATARGVTLEAKCAVPPELPIEDTKLCSLLFNLLDNAIEAAAASNPKAVEISLLRKASLLLLRVRNTVAPGAPARHLNLHTTKPDKAAHGYGVQIIRQIVAEYNGTCQYTSADGWFTAEIMLTLEDAGKEAAHG